MGILSAKQTRKPWYAQGLRFACQGCGHCCGGGPGYVWMDDDEVQQIARYLGLEVEEFQRLYGRRLWRGLSLKEEPDFDCVMLDAESRCAIYPVRPRQCRVWPFWPSNLGSRDAWESAARRCPGIGQGPIWSLEQIEAKRMEMRV